MNSSPFVIEAGSDNFDTAVLEKSRHTLVGVDFWAAWCAPCRVLMPLLQKLAGEYQGKFLLAKVNSDEQPELTNRWGVRSLPTVKLFKDGQAVDEFMGAQPESVIRAILEKYLPRESDALRDKAHAALQDGDTAQALQLLQQALAADPDHLPVKLDLAAALMQSGKAMEAEKILDELPLQQREEPATRQLVAQLGFARAAQHAPDLKILQQRIDAGPADLQARYDLGALLILKEDFSAALEQFLEIMKRDRHFENDIGRRSLLAAFELLGADHALVQQYRRKMAPLLH